MKRHIVNRNGAFSLQICSAVMNLVHQENLFRLNLLRLLFLSYST